MYKINFILSKTKTGIEPEDIVNFFETKIGSNSKKSVFNRKPEDNVISFETKIEPKPKVIELFWLENQKNLILSETKTDTKLKIGR